MKIENQVCPLEQAKRLKELGIVSNESSHLFDWWYTEIPTRDGMDNSIHIARSFDKSTSINTEYYPAFTVAELGVMLPCRVWDNGMYELTLTKSDDAWHEESTGTKTEFMYEYLMANSDCKFSVLNSFQSQYNTEAEARAAMLIHLLESGTITASDCNARLLNA